MKNPQKKKAWFVLVGLLAAGATTLLTLIVGRGGLRECNLPQGDAEIEIDLKDAGADEPRVPSELSRSRLTVRRGDLNDSGTETEQHLRGRVEDYSGRALSGIMCRFVSAEVEREILSKDDGEFVFSYGVAEGGRLTLSSDDTNAFSIGVAGPCDLGTIRLDRLVNLEVSVVDESYFPVDGAILYVRQDVGGTGVTLGETGITGIAKLRLSRRATRLLYVNAEGFLTEFRRIEGTEDQITVVMHKSPVVSGRVVVAGTTDGIAGAAVQVDSLWHIETNEMGFFEIAAPREAAFTLSASKNGFGPTFVNLAIAPSSGDLRSVLLELEEGAAIYGIVKSGELESGPLWAKATELESGNTWPWNRKSVIDGGRFVVDGIPPHRPIALTFDVLPGLTTRVKQEPLQPGERRDIGVVEISRPVHVSIGFIVPQEIVRDVCLTYSWFPLSVQGSRVLPTGDVFEVPLLDTRIPFSILVPGSGRIDVNVLADGFAGETARQILREENETITVELHKTFCITGILVGDAACFGESSVLLTRVGGHGNHSGRVLMDGTFEICGVSEGLFDVFFHSTSQACPFPSGPILKEVHLYRESQPLAISTPSNDCIVRGAVVFANEVERKTSARLAVFVNAVDDQGRRFQVPLRTDGSFSITTLGAVLERVELTADISVLLSNPWLADYRLEAPIDYSKSLSLSKR